MSPTDEAAGHDRVAEIAAELNGLADRGALCGGNHRMLAGCPVLLDTLGLTKEQTNTAYLRIANLLWRGQDLDADLRAVIYALGISHPDLNHPDGAKFIKITGITRRREGFGRTVQRNAINTIRTIEKAGFEKLAALLTGSNNDVALQYVVDDHEVLWVFTEQGSKELQVTRTVMSMVDGLEMMTDRFGGSGNPAIRYEYVGVYGCKVESNEILSTQTNAVMGTIRLAKPLMKGQRLTYKYRIQVAERSEPDAVEVLNPYVTSVHRPEYRITRAVLRVAFAKDRVPTRAWFLAGTVLYEVPGRPIPAAELAIVGGCVEHEFRELKPGLHYSLCWEWPTIPRPAEGQAT